MTEHIIRNVLRVPNGAYIGDTAEMRRKFPDAPRLRIQKPTYEEAKNGVGYIELPAEDEIDGESENSDEASDPTGTGGEPDNGIDNSDLG